jgi:hypothetical protein
VTPHCERLAYGTACLYFPRLQTNGQADLDLAGDRPSFKAVKTKLPCPHAAEPGRRDDGDAHSQVSTLIILVGK